MTNKIYFRGLDAYRGIAAILVILGHTEQIKMINGIDHSFNKGLFLFHLGSISVTFFFVLSGFLITYLILVEETNNVRLDVKSFYVRRILRIWPVYYLMIFIGFFIFQNDFITFSEFSIPKVPIDQYRSSLFYYLVFLPHIANFSNPLCFQAWSIGVEEIFYLFWPLIFWFFRSYKIRLYVLIAIYFGLPFIKISPHLFPDIEIFKTLKSFFIQARFEDMALGGIVAIMLYKKCIPRKFYINVFLIIVMCVCLIFELKLPFSLESVLYPILFSNLIVFTIYITNENSILENKIFKFLGKISYGLYMYHVVAIYLTANIFAFFFKSTNLFSIFFVHISVLVFSTFIASLSYYFMERPILKLKKRFSKINTN